MCGLAGNNFGDDALVRAMLERIRHRGPDGDGLATDGDVVHGHVRLALLDPTAASSQPFRHDGSLLAFNGEIWNYRELRAELRGPFATTGDTEVLAQLLSERGLDGLRDVDGMFAFSWSYPRHGSWLVRDAHGKVPLYYDRERRGVSWASERKAFVNGAGVVALPPGHALDLATGRVRRWDRGVAAADPTPARVLELLDRGVRRRLNADAPVCCLISGGLDSALVLALARRVAPNVTAFVAYADERSADLAAARRLCGELGVTLVEVAVQLEERHFVDAMRAIEINSKAQVEIAALCIPLARAISERGFKACLSGEAADELFGGYGNFQIAASKANDEGVRVLRRAQLAKMSRGNFVRCNKVFMSAGVECRLPFMDRDLVSLAVEATKEANPPGKKLLKLAAKDLVPSWVIKRTKETFQGAGGSADVAAKNFANPTRLYNAELTRMFGYLPKE